MEGRHGRRFSHRAEQERGLSLGQLCAAVAWHYKLTPEQVANLSGPQLVMWYERARVERGEEKLLDLQLVIAPHTENATDTVRNLQRALQKMIDKK